MATWTTIQTFSNRPEAEAAKTLLQESGIVALVKADDAGGMRPELNLSGGVRLQVQTKNAEEAREALGLAPG
jgi:hypothetical protein